MGVLVAQWLGRRTSHPAILGSISRPRIIRHLGQLSLPSVWGRTASQRYNMRERSHSLQLPEHSAHLSDCNFIIRMLYKNAY